MDNQGSCSHLVNYISPLLVTCKSISKGEYLNILNDDIFVGNGWLCVWSILTFNQSASNSSKLGVIHVPLTKIICMCFFPSI